MGSFAPLVFGANGGMGGDCNCFLKRLAEKLSENNEEPNHITITWISDVSIISTVGRGWKQRESHNFVWSREKWAVKRLMVMQIYARDHVEVHPQKKKEVLYLVRKKRKKERKKQEQRNITDINCKVLLQEFNKHLRFIYNNAIESY